MSVIKFADAGRRMKKNITLLAFFWMAVVDAQFCHDTDKVPKVNYVNVVKTATAICSYKCGFSRSQTKPVGVTYTTSECSLGYDYKPKTTCCEGYHQARHKCIPTCENDCIFGSCTAPNVCTCYAGYKKGSPTSCIPICEECTNGKCVAPNECVCNAGYAKNSDDKCVPKCEPGCINGNCTYPNKCECLDGYHFNSKLRREFGVPDQTVCSPLCDTECLDGYCIKPNTCVCNEGFKLTANNTCEPICDEFDCQNGNCVAPNECDCDFGFAKGISNCIPECYQMCINGYCIAPNQCKCNDGYEENEFDDCIPICDAPCENGTCVAPNVCECLSGFTALDNNTNSCEPVCSEEYVNCTHGYCNAPNECDCFPDYELQTIEFGVQECVPKCSECMYGDCVAPNYCQCHEGYQHSSGVFHECDPVCDNPCGRGICVAPNWCACHPGFVTNENGTCSPECDFCFNGVCDDGICVCDDGYAMSPEGSCEPSCANCTNGTCNDLNICECDVGYDYSNTTNDCVPFCSSCDNGICIGYEICECSDGFAYGNTNKSLCVAVTKSIPQKLKKTNYLLWVIVAAATAATIASVYLVQRKRSKNTLLEHSDVISNPTFDVTSKEI